MYIANKTVGFIEVKIIYVTALWEKLKYQQFVLAVFAELDPVLTSLYTTKNIKDMFLVLN